MIDQLLNHPDALYWVYTALALGLFVLMTGLYQLVRRSENRQEARSRRMKMIERGASTAEIIAVLKPVERGNWMVRLPFFGDLPKVMRQAGMTGSPTTVLTICGVLATVIAAAASFALTIPQAVAVGFVLGLFLPIALIRSRSKARVDALTKLLPEALDLMARGLRVGHPLNTSIAAVAEEMPDPIGTEFGLVADQVSFGEDLVDAFTEFAERIDTEDVHYLCASIGIQHGTGGDLARVLEVLSKVIRNRIAMRRRIQAISAEGRMSAYFLSALPIVIFGGTSIMTPTYYSEVYNDPLFAPMAVLVVGFTLMNAIILTRLVKFRI